MKKLSMKLAVLMMVGMGICMYGSADNKEWYKGDKDFAKVQKDMRMEEKSSFEDKFYKGIFFIFMHAKEIDLTEAQMEKIHAVKIDVKKSLEMKEAEINVLGIELEEEFNKDEVDLKAVNTLIDKKYEIKKVVAKEIAKACADIHTILNKDQTKKLKDLCFNEHMDKYRHMLKCCMCYKCGNGPKDKKPM